MSERIPTNLRTLLILEILGTAGVPMTPTEIARQIDLPKQTVHRLCATLVEEGFLVRETSGKRLRPARRMRQLAADTLHASHYQLARHQILLKVADRVQETVNFVVPQADGMRYLDRVESRWPFRIQLPIGTHVPFHCTASGKTYLASLPALNRRNMVAGL
ncbi:MAG: IclR family transcriptional regulator, partial [Alphaproteobacteria bacterium]